MERCDGREEEGWNRKGLVNLRKCVRTEVVLVNNCGERTRL